MFRTFLLTALEGEGFKENNDIEKHCLFVFSLLSYEYWLYIDGFHVWFFLCEVFLRRKKQNAETEKGEGKF